MALRHLQPGETASSLEEEQDFFEEHRAEWLRDHEGEVALVKGRKLVGFYSADVEAFEAGVACFGYQPMLIKEVSEKDPVSLLFSPIS